MSEEHITSLIGAKIRQFRLEKAYSQDYMAEKLGMTQSGYSRSENNAGEISISKLSEIANLLEVRLSDLISGSKLANYFQNNSGENNSSGGNIVINQYSDERLERMEKMLEKLVNKGRSA